MESLDLSKPQKSVHVQLRAGGDYLTDFKRGFSTCNFGEAPQVDMSPDPYQAAIMTSCDSQLLNFERLLLSFFNALPTFK